MSGRNRRQLMPEQLAAERDQWAEALARLAARRGRDLAAIRNCPRRPFPGEDPSVGPPPAADLPSAGRYAEALGAARRRACRRAS